jgi:hypothetical protein
VDHDKTAGSFQLEQVHTSVLDVHVAFDFMRWVHSICLDTLDVLSAKHNEC